MSLWIAIPLLLLLFVIAISLLVIAGGMIVLNDRLKQTQQFHANMETLMRVAYYFYERARK